MNIEITRTDADYADLRVTFNNGAHAIVRVFDSTTDRLSRPFARGMVSVHDGPDAMLAAKTYHLP